MNHLQTIRVMCRGLTPGCQYSFGSEGLQGLAQPPGLSDGQVVLQTLEILQSSKLPASCEVPSPG